MITTVPVVVIQYKALFSSENIWPVVCMADILSSPQLILDRYPEMHTSSSFSSLSLISFTARFLLVRNSECFNFQALTKLIYVTTSLLYWRHSLVFLIN